MKKTVFWIAGAILLTVLLVAIFLIVTRPGNFNADRALQNVQYQISLGPRIPGSDAHTKAGDWISALLKKYGWEVEIQEGAMDGHPIRNIIAKRGNKGSWVILGAHYDTRMYADQDLNAAFQALPVPGANDGASGVAVLLEIARVLPRDQDKQIWLVFFDAEDQGNLPGWNWILGSQYFVDHLSADPDAVVIIDMIGDKDLGVYWEQNSDQTISSQIWQRANEIGYSKSFIPELKYSMLDDHTPFIRKGIPAVDIIDFDYPYWHTTEDTADKVSAESLKAIGDTLLAWIAPAN